MPVAVDGSLQSTETLSLAPGCRLTNPDCVKAVGGAEELVHENPVIVMLWPVYPKVNERSPFVDSVGCVQR